MVATLALAGATALAAVATVQPEALPSLGTTVADLQRMTVAAGTTGGTAPDASTPAADVSISEAQGPAPKSSDEGVAAPDSLAVPSLGIRARVVPITSTGTTLEPPEDPRLLGWWTAGAAPGSGRGHALVTGHTVHTGGGVLDDLDRAEPGARITLGTSGPDLHYVVESVAYYTVEELATAAPRLFRTTGPDRLALVTCENWDGEEYEGNFVVLARPVPH